MLTMASCHVVLTLLLMSPFSSWGFSSSHDHSRILTRGLQPHSHHLHNSTAPNPNATSFWGQAISQLVNVLTGELKPDPSQLPTTVNSGSTTPAPSTTPDSSDWEDWDLDDFNSCRDAMQSVIRRLTMPRT